MNKLFFYIVGNEKYAQELIGSIKIDQVQFKLIPEDRVINKMTFRQNLVGFILIPPFRSTSIFYLLRNFKSLKRLRKYPTFIVSDRSLQPTTVHEFYKYGAEGVFSFKDEKEKIIQTVLRLTKRFYDKASEEDKNKLHIKKKTIKEKITDLLQIRFNLSKRFSNFKVRVKNRFKAKVKGKVNTPFDERKVIELASVIPGVTAVDHQDVMVKDYDADEIEIKKKLLLLMNILKQKGISSQVEFKVQGRTIFIVGEIQKRGEDELIHHCVERIKGVEKIVNNMFLSDQLIYQQEEELDEIEEQLMAQFTSLRDIRLQRKEDNTIDIYGRASLKAVRPLVSDFVLQNSRAKKVRNKITVQ